MAPLFPQTGTIPSMVNQPTLNNPYQANQIPGMSINFPSLLQPQQNQTPNPVLAGVHGFDSVKQYPFKPNQTLAFHDSVPRASKETGVRAKTSFLPNNISKNYV